MSATASNSSENNNTPGGEAGGPVVGAGVVGVVPPPPPGATVVVVVAGGLVVVVVVDVVGTGGAVVGAGGAVVGAGGLVVVVVVDVESLALTRNVAAMWFQWYRSPQPVLKMPTRAMYIPGLASAGTSQFTSNCLETPGKKLWPSQKCWYVRTPSRVLISMSTSAVRAEAAVTEMSNAMLSPWCTVVGETERSVVQPLLAIGEASAAWGTAMRPTPTANASVALTGARLDRFGDERASRRIIRVFTCLLPLGSSAGRLPIRRPNITELKRNCHLLLLGNIRDAGGVTRSSDFPDSHRRQRHLEDGIAASPRRAIVTRR